MIWKNGSASRKNDGEQKVKVEPFVAALFDDPSPPATRKAKSAFAAHARTASRRLALRIF
ncbi:MAG: hypothetical protein LC778_20620 [Acidobacteria bacterium]|nr:hypothetical protein [Acidobacteriota bacterium]